MKGLVAAVVVVTAVASCALGFRIPPVFRLSFDPESLLIHGTDNDHYLVKQVPSGGNQPLARSRRNSGFAKKQHDAEYHLTTREGIFPNNNGSRKVVHKLTTDQLNKVYGSWVLSTVMVLHNVSAVDKVCTQFFSIGAADQDQYPSLCLTAIPQKYPQHVNQAEEESSEPPPNVEHGISLQTCFGNVQLSLHQMFYLSNNHTVIRPMLHPDWRVVRNQSLGTYELKKDSYDFTNPSDEGAMEQFEPGEGEVQYVGPCDPILLPPSEEVILPPSAEKIPLVHDASANDGVNGTMGNNTERSGNATRSMESMVTSTEKEQQTPTSTEHDEITKEGLNDSKEGKRTVEESAVTTASTEKSTGKAKGGDDVKKEVTESQTTEKDKATKSPDGQEGEPKKEKEKVATKRPANQHNDEGKEKKEKGTTESPGDTREGEEITGDAETTITVKSTTHEETQQPPSDKDSIGEEDSTMKTTRMNPKVKDDEEEKEETEGPNEDSTKAEAEREDNENIKDEKPKGDKGEKDREEVDEAQEEEEVGEEKGPISSRVRGEKERVKKHRRFHNKDQNIDHILNDDHRSEKGHLESSKEEPSETDGDHENKGADRDFESKANGSSRHRMSALQHQTGSKKHRSQDDDNDDDDEGNRRRRGHRRHQQEEGRVNDESRDDDARKHWSPRFHHVE